MDLYFCDYFDNCNCKLEVMKATITCSEGASKSVNIFFIPNKKKYMCKSIRQYYTKKEFIQKGMSIEDAERISKTIVG